MMVLQQSVGRQAPCDRLAFTHRSIAVRAQYRRPIIVRPHAVVVPEAVTEPVPSKVTQTGQGPAPFPLLEAAPPRPYAWRRNWVPVAPVSYLDPSRPTPVTLLGEALVVWQHAGRREWVVMRDACPHRLAPLSEGRLEAGGTRLACAYHGWEFSEQGECTRVPQLAADSKAAATACASPRACATSYPTLLECGVLFAWLDASAEGLAAAAAAPRPRLFSEAATPSTDWSMNELPNDYRFWVEQGMDPAHANFLHHGLFNQYDSVPLEGGRVRDIDLHKGWRWEHRGYDRKNKDMHAVREFAAPFIIRVEYEQPSGLVFHICTMQVPVRPGVSRVYFRAGSSKRPPRQLTAGKEALPAAEAGMAAATATGGTGSSAAGAASAAATQETVGFGTEGEAKAKAQAGGGNETLTAKIPHWLLSPTTIADQDCIMMCRQELLMRQQGLDFRSYNLNSRSDEGVSAINRWLQLAGYPNSLWGAPSATAGAGAAGALAGQTYRGWPEQALPLETILSRQERHVRHCAVCQRALQSVTRVCVALSVAAGLAASGAAAMAALAAVSPHGLAAVGGAQQLAGAVGVAAALTWLAVQGWAFREERFVSGVANWRRIGGFAALNFKK